MDPIEQMLLLFFAGALVCALLLGLARRGPSGAERDAAALRAQNERLQGRIEWLVIEYGLPAGLLDDHLDSVEQPVMDDADWRGHGQF